MINDNLVKIFERSFRDNWELPALSEYGENNTVTYGEFAKEIARIHIFYRTLGIKKGDKVALLGKSNAHWVTIFTATVTYGAVVVPILHEFNPQDAQHIVNHSDSKLLFICEKIWEVFDFDNIKKVKGVVSLDTLEVLYESTPKSVTTAAESIDKVFNRAYADGFTRKCVKYPEVPNDAVAEINYTSGTTGFSKGVMLTINNLTGNVVFGMESKLHYRGSKTLSFLPLAHAYGCAFDMLAPLAVGAHITLLGKIPTPKVLIKAMGEIRPHLLLSVPLVFEKIYRKMILPMLDKPSMKIALSIPGVRDVIYAKIRKKLIAAFGGRFSEVIIGGAALNGEVEDFMRKIKFPFTVGYGMTECGPLISYTDWNEFRLRSSGRLLTIMKAKIDSIDPENVPGEICVKGENVMLGYYKNEEATRAVIDRDGWLHTGDIGVLSADGTLSLRGRSKTMILSASGQNVYPEEIEAKLNVNPLVSESLVMEKDGKIVALVYPDAETMDANGLFNGDIEKYLEDVRKDVNKLLAPYEQISRISAMAQEFEKTPKKSIKRYLYTH